MANKKQKDKIKGGKGDKVPESKLSKKQLDMGQKVEKEHTSDPEAAREIARDHLSEELQEGKGKKKQKYYSKLKKMHKDSSVDLEGLAALANHLDALGYYEEAGMLDDIIKSAAETPPKKYRETGAKSRSDYADPENYKYPIHTESNVRAALSYFSKPANANKYPPAKRKSIWNKILAAARKYKIEISDKAGPPSQEKKKK